MTNPTPPRPDAGQRILAAGIDTHYHDQGSWFPLLMLHGSGPGVSAWANWRLVLPGLANGAQAEGQKLGLLQRTIYDTAVTLLDFESLLKEDDLIAAVVASQPKPPGEDNRRRNVKRELPKLVKRGMLLSAAGYVQLPQSESAANDE